MLFNCINKGSFFKDLITQIHSSDLKFNAEENVRFGAFSCWIHKLTYNKGLH